MKQDDADIFANYTKINRKKVKIQKEDDDFLYQKSDKKAKKRR